MEEMINFMNNSIYGSIIYKIILFILLILLGIFLGKLVKLFFRKVLEKIHISLLINKGVLEATLLVIKWSIYIIFINLAIIQLEIPQITKFITDTLMIIPAITGSLIMISLGFTIGLQLKKIVASGEIKSSEFISSGLFYFINGIAGIYAIKLALISLDPFISNMIALGFSIVYMIVIGFYIIKSKC
jgi:hypothetical protein